MPQYGHIQRTKPRLTVLRGFDPNEPCTRQIAYRVKADVTIKSGQLISKEWNATDSVYEWKLGVDASSEGGLQAIPYFALQDSTDEDVIEAGTLVGLSCAGQFTLETAYYKTGETYKDGVFLTYDGVTGNIKPVASVAEGTEGDTAIPVIGVITRNHDIKSLVGVNSSATNLNVVALDTMFLPNNFNLAT